MWIVRAGPKCAFEMRVNFSRNVKENQVAITVALIVLLSGLRTVLSSRLEKSEWWLDPCNTQLQKRHARSTVTRQMSYSINNINELKKELTALYPKFPHKTRHKSINCLNIKKLIKPVINAKTKLDASIQFYISMTQISMFLEKLRRIQLVHQSRELNVSKRSEYYDNMKSNIKLILCEFSTDIEQYPEQKRTLYDKVRKLPNKDIKCLPNPLDHTYAQMYDFISHSKTLKFLRQVRNYLRKLLMRKSVDRKKNQRKKKRTKREVLFPN